MGAPCVFISYAHSSDEHALIVTTLANALLSDGFDVKLDQFESYGASLDRFMDADIERADRVLMIVDDAYLQKVNDVGSGVHRENIKLQELHSGRPESWIAPAMRRSEWQLPAWLRQHNPKGFAMGVPGEALPTQFLSDVRTWASGLTSGTSPGLTLAGALERSRVLAKIDSSNRHARHQYPTPVGEAVIDYEVTNPVHLGLDPWRFVLDMTAAGDDSVYIYNEDAALHRIGLLASEQPGLTPVQVANALSGNPRFLLWGVGGAAALINSAGFVCVLKLESLQLESLSCGSSRRMAKVSWQVLGAES